ncbi:MAG TPA: hypothetical protein ENK05_08145 [Gammaproteobacteria bacterium]|nr:hypothetical protein [Gammaproteobacteria bacterium]
MRARTSLAGHILGSHPSINGYFEMHISYEDGSALERQLELLQRHERLKEGSRYLFDKLLHDDYRLLPDQLGPTDTKILVSLLEPERSIRSIVALFRQKKTRAPYASAPEAARYYIERIETLARFARSTPGGYYYYDAASLVDTPEALLSRLTRWLELDTPLEPRYRLFSQTGKPRMGDSSGLIRSGRIRRTRSDYSHIELPREELVQALDRYRGCRAQLIDHARDSFLSTAQ